MCEIVGAAFDEPQTLSRLYKWAVTLENYGLAGFGWGVAWLTSDGGVAVEKGLGRFSEEVEGRGLLNTASRRFLVHLRRPTKLSTVEYADTQPFVHGQQYAFCHNGSFDRAESVRPRYADRLVGKADSEVGWCCFQDEVDAGVPVTEALEHTDQALGGRVNVAYLDDSGLLAAYGRNEINAFWQFGVGGARVVSTALHSDDDSVFRLVYPQSIQRRLLPSGTGTVIAESLSP